MVDSVRAALAEADDYGELAAAVQAALGQHEPRAAVPAGRHGPPGLGRPARPDGAVPAARRGGRRGGLPDPGLQARPGLRPGHGRPGQPAGHRGGPRAAAGDQRQRRHRPAAGAGQRPDRGGGRGGRAGGPAAVPDRRAGRLPGRGLRRADHRLTRRRPGPADVGVRGGHRRDAVQAERGRAGRLLRHRVRDQLGPGTRGGAAEPEPAGPARHGDPACRVEAAGRPAVDRRDGLPGRLTAPEPGGRAEPARPAARCSCPGSSGSTATSARARWSSWSTCGTRSG